MTPESLIQLMQAEEKVRKNNAEMEKELADARKLEKTLRQNIESYLTKLSGMEAELLETRKRITELSQIHDTDLAEWNKHTEFLEGKVKELEADKFELGVKAALRSTDLKLAEAENSALKSGGVDGFVAPRGEIRTCVFSVHDVWNGQGRKARIILCAPEGPRKLWLEKE